MDGIRRAEIIEDFAGERVDYWVTGYGTGGTLKGVARVLRCERQETKVIVCEPTDAPRLSSGIEQKRKSDARPLHDRPADATHAYTALGPGLFVGVLGAGNANRTSAGDADLRGDP